MCGNYIELIEKENRKIKLYVHSLKNDIFVIRTATVDIIQYGSLIKTIEGTIDCHDIIFNLGLDAPGLYDMVVTYEIADEIIKSKFKVKVIEDGEI